MRKNKNDVIFDGVCSGIARYFDIEPIWVRLMFALGGFAGLYIILMFIMSEDE